MSFPKESLESLWCPWRVEYYEARREASVGDFLLEAAQTSDDAAHLVVARGKLTYLLMNRYPYACGHLMAVPNRKVAGMEELTSEESSEIWRLTVHAQTLLRQAVKAQGFNVGINLGIAAGAGKEDHLHIHIVPRWPNDYNFMPVLAGTRIIPEALEPLYRRLCEIHREIGFSY